MAYHILYHSIVFCKDKTDRTGLLRKIRRAPGGGAGGYLCAGVGLWYNTFEQRVPAAA